MLITLTLEGFVVLLLITPLVIASVALLDRLIRSPVAIGRRLALLGALVIILVLLFLLLSTVITVPV